MMFFGYLGPLLVQPDGAEVLLTPRRLRILLAALLARAGRPVHRDELAELVWDGQPPGQAVDTLRTYVMRLRHALGAAAGQRVITHDPGYLIEASEDEVDALRFARAYHDGGAAYRAAQWSAARAVLAAGLDLWRGEVLSDVRSQLLRDAERPALERLRLQALQWRIDCDLRLGGGGELVNELRFLIAHEPLHEQLYAMLMTALAACGQSSEALSVYQQARQALIGNLAIEPGAELQDLQRRILAGEPVPATLRADVSHQTAATGPIPRQLPAVVSHFAGRAAELKALDAILATIGAGGGAVAISAIGGMAGIGKTTLALRWAHRVRAQFPDGQLYVNLRGFGPAAPMSPEDAIRGFLAALCDPAKPLPPDLDAQAALYRSLTADRRMLVVLDNAGDEEQVRPLLPGPARSLTLITSRRLLTGLITTNGAASMRLDQLSQEQARELLSARLGAQTMAEEPDAVDQIIAVCAGLPLALAIVAARAAVSRERKLTALAAQLSQSRSDVLSSTDPYADLRSVFSWSYRKLSPGAARLFRCLPSFPGPDLTPDVVASIVPAAQVSRLLAELAGVCMLEEYVPGRFRLHDLLARFAEECSRQEDTDLAREETLDRILTWYVSAATAAAHRIGLGRNSLRPAKAPEPLPEELTTSPGALAWLETERRNLIAALHVAVRYGFDAVAVALPLAMVPLFELRALLNDWRDACVIGLESAAQIGDTDAEAYLYRALAGAYRGLGRREDCIEAMQRALDIWQRAGNVTGEVVARRNLGLVYFEAGRVAEAIAESEQAILIARRGGDERLAGSVLNNLGWMYDQAGQPERALDCFLLALAAAGTGDPITAGTIQANLADVHVKLGRLDDAIAAAMAALALVAQTGVPLTTADTHRSLGDALDRKGRHEEARTHWRTALALYQELEDPRAVELTVRLGERLARRLRRAGAED